MSSFAHLDWRSAACVIDHTLLHPDATHDRIVQLCREAAAYGCAAVCIHPCWVPLAVSLLRPTPVKVCSVVGFPHGATLTSVKRTEAAELLRLGADELDMVINIGALKSGDSARVLADIRGVAEIARTAGALLKVILETALLTRDEKILACRISLEAGVDFVKTSTGFAEAGATVEDVALLDGYVPGSKGMVPQGKKRLYIQVAKVMAFQHAPHTDREQ